jgi:hypothetical protein
MKWILIATFLYSNTHTIAVEFSSFEKCTSAGEHLEDLHNLYYKQVKWICVEK